MDADEAVGAFPELPRSLFRQEKVRNIEQLRRFLIWNE